VDARILSETLVCHGITVSAAYEQAGRPYQMLKNARKNDGLLTPRMSAFTMKVSLAKANPIQMNTFGARSLPAARSVQDRIGIRFRFPAR
jgi:hypothetical protein